MNNTNTGGPAFPTEAYDLERQTLVREEGMTLRDYFAAKAMQGLSQNIDWNVQTTGGVAGVAYALADAMLRAREQ
jgi:hypothetical protein